MNVNQLGFDCICKLNSPLGHSEYNEKANSTCKYKKDHRPCFIQRTMVFSLHMQIEFAWLRFKQLSMSPFIRSCVR